MNADGSNKHPVTKEIIQACSIMPHGRPTEQFLVARKHFTGTRSLGCRRNVDVS